MGQNLEYSERALTFALSNAQSGDTHHTYVLGRDTQDSCSICETTIGHPCSHAQAVACRQSAKAKKMLVALNFLHTVTILSQSNL